MRLNVELVPETCFFKNLRSELNKADWDVLRKQTYKACDYRCEICGGKGKKWPTECHEIFHYDDTEHVQTLIGLEGLCPLCHSVKHFGHTQLRGAADEALKHMAKVNECTYAECIKYLEGVFKLWEQRSTHQWSQDLSFLSRFDVTLPGSKAEDTTSGLYGTNPLSIMASKANGDAHEEESCDATDTGWFD